ncbi:MAG TPA: YkgJ family cysteine cluster protein [Clostridiales bacterium]|mgnify:CR=1 FL=1|nr:YkgJ family cysteine cluster protein [Clostridiales bacterium]
MIHLEVIDDKIELVEYSDDASLQELSDEVNSFRLKNALKTRDCKGCGECCNQPIPVFGLDLINIQKKTGLELNDVLSRYVVLPERPDLDERCRGIEDFMRTCGLDETEAAIMYEYNQCEPLILPRKKDGTCEFLDKKTGLCTIFNYRPFTGGLYLCNMGDELSIIQEMVVRHGTWHAYSILGWISEKEIGYNPFLKVDSYDKIYIKDFNFNPEEALGKLFFYF